MKYLLNIPSNPKQKAFTRLVLGFAAALTLSAVPLGAARAQAGLVQELTDLRQRITALESLLDAQQKQEIDRAAQIVCGGINANIVIGDKDRNWDYGRPQRMTEPTTCSDLCSKSAQDTKACDGLVLIYNGATYITGNKCSYKPPENYFSKTDHVFCCCR